MVVKEIQGSSLNSKKSIYGFETLSFVPYDLRLINKEQLEPREIDWINDIGQHQIVDCQICCQPIEIEILQLGDDVQIKAHRDDE